MATVTASQPEIVFTPEVGVTLELNLEEALYVLGHLGAGSQWSILKTPEASVYTELLRALEEVVDDPFNHPTTQAAYTQ